MRNICFYFLIILNSLLYPMSVGKPEKKANRGWIGELYHYVDSTINPIPYFTDNDAIPLHEQLLQFDPEHPEFTELTLDTECIDIISSGFNRQKALHKATRQESEKKDGNMEALRLAYERQPGYYPPIVIAILLGYLETSIDLAHNKTRVLEKQSHLQLLAAKSKSSANESNNFPTESRFPTYDNVYQTVMNSHTTVSAKFWNYVGKNYLEKARYLIDQKSQDTCMAALHFNPEHPYHAMWKFNCSEPFHIQLVKQTTERADHILDYIMDVITKKIPVNSLIDINPNNPANKIVMENINGLFSPVAKAVISGLLYKMAREQKATLSALQLKEREQKELADKSQEINVLINSLRRKLSSPDNQEKLKSLDATERNTPIIAGNKLTTNRGAGLPEVREAHAMLIDFSKKLEQLLAASSPACPSPALTHSATTLPSFAPLPSSPKVPSHSPACPAQPFPAIQSVVNTEHLAAPTSAAAPVVVITQTPLAPPPTQTAPVITAPEFQAAAPKIVKQESATSVITPNSLSPKAESPQASPPRSPGGSLLEDTVTAPANTLAKSFDEEFDPRAPVSSAATDKPATPPAQPEAPVTKSGKNKNKKSN